MKDLKKDQPVDVEVKQTSEVSTLPYPAKGPYHENYYLLYGYENEPESIDSHATKEFLKKIGFGKSFLKKAREGKNISEEIAMQNPKDNNNVIYCDFCGAELSGAEFDYLNDGRKRCSNCTRTAIRTEADFVKLYNDITENMRLFFGINIKSSVRIKMVNAQELHAQFGLSFVPSAGMTPRALGVAIEDKADGYKIFVENGSPRISAIGTLVHELTHIWQYENWNKLEILSTYGQAQNIEVYEGMAKWVEVQYMFLLGEFNTAKRWELETTMRDDEYGHGFVKYTLVHPLSRGMSLEGTTPFDKKSKPL